METGTSVTAFISFSIVMPAYNSEATIDAAIESVLRQTRRDFELIVVDDGSTDNTVARVERYLGAGRIKLITQPHLGSSAARNRAIAESVGEYVSLLDSDDVWLPRYLEVMGETLNANPQAAVAFTDAWVLNDDIKKIARRTAMSAWRPSTDPSEPAAFLRALLEHGNFVYASATVRRPVLVDVGGFREALPACVDYELWLRIAANGYRFIRCPEILAVYRRRRAGQITSNPATMERAFSEVFRIVAEEYDVADEIRALALRLMREQEPRIRKARQRRRSSRLPPAAFRLYRPVWRLRWFFLRPPAEVREAFPNIDVI
jgi:glycosyltransferase involved in cell wall biosynthesis